MPKDYLTIADRMAPDLRTIYMRGFPGDVNMDSIRNFFLEYGRCSVAFHKKSRDQQNLFLALRFDDPEVAEQILRRYDDRKILGYRIQMQYFKNHQQAREMADDRYDRRPDRQRHHRRDPERESHQGDLRAALNNQRPRSDANSSNSRSRNEHYEHSDHRSVDDNHHDHDVISLGSASESLQSHRDSRHRSKEENRYQSHRESRTSSKHHRRSRSPRDRKRKYNADPLSNHHSKSNGTSHREQVFPVSSLESPKRGASNSIICAPSNTLVCVNVDTSNSQDSEPHVADKQALEQIKAEAMEAFRKQSEMIVCVASMFVKIKPSAADLFQTCMVEALKQVNEAVSSKAIESLKQFARN